MSEWKNMRTQEEEKQCEHKWIPNGIVKREIWRGEGCNSDPRIKWGETTMASCICEKCGKIKIESENF